MNPQYRHLGSLMERERTLRAFSATTCARPAVAAMASTDDRSTVRADGGGSRGCRSAGGDAVAPPQWGERCSTPGRLLTRAPWPVFDADVAKADVEVVVRRQVNGSARLTVPADP